MRFNKVINVILLGSCIFSFGCTARYTKQFVVPHKNKQKQAESIAVKGWAVDPPGVVAYSDIKSLNEVKNPNMFWLTIRTRHPLKDINAELLKFSIDSVGVIFYTLDSNYFTDTAGTNEVQIFESPFFRKTVNTKKKNHPITIVPKIIETSEELLEISKLDGLFKEVTTVWTTPSRTAPFIDTRGKHKHFAFDFFRDKGIEIPDHIIKIKLFFNASMTSAGNEAKTDEYLEFHMMRDDKSLATPFMMQ